jgi:hypothetical protein
MFLSFAAICVQGDTPETRKTAAWPEVKRMLINWDHETACRG